MVWWAIALGAINGPPTMLHYTKFAATSDQWGCKAVAVAMLSEEVEFAESNKYGGKLRVIAERGTDTLSLKVDRAARTLLILSGAGVRIGVIEPDEMTIVRNDDSALVAIQTIPLSANVFVLRLDRQTGNAVWGKVGDLLGVQVGWVQYLECR